MIGKLIPWKTRHDGDTSIRESQTHPAVQLRNEFDALWDRLLDESQSANSRIDFDDDEKEYVLRAELPGFDPEELDVKVSGNVLTLRAEHKEEGKEGNGKYRRHNTFYESFTLPQGVLTEKTEARYRSGVLEVHLPKGEDSKAKRIAVKSS